jgi:hypothetical protein
MAKRKKGQQDKQRRDLIRFLCLQLPIQTVCITTKVVSSNPVNEEMYSLQHYV